jgi:hypothetical protein
LQRILSQGDLTPAGTAGKEAEETLGLAQIASYSSDKLFLKHVDSIGEGGLRREGLRTSWYLGPGINFFYTAILLPPNLVGIIIYLLV